MSFSRAQIRRFNEVQTQSPPVGTYDPKVDGTIPYPKDDAVYLRRRNSWMGSTQSLWSMNSGRLSSRSSCASVASERIAKRFESAECLGVVSAGWQRVWSARDGGKEGGRPDSWRGVTGWARSKAASEASMKEGVNAIGGDRGGLARRKPKDDAMAQAKYEANVEGSCEMRAKAESLVGPETGGKVGGKPMNEATGAISNEVVIEPYDEAKCKNSRETTSEAIIKANFQANGESTAHYKGISKHAPSFSTEVESEIDQPERLPKETTQEWQQEKPSVFLSNHRLRTETRTFELNLLKSDRKRLTDWKGSLSSKQVQDSSSGQQKRVLKRFPTGSSGLLIDVVEQISREEEEAEALRTRVNELEREKAELQQAKISMEGEFKDEVSWRKEELEKAEALVEKLRGAKRRGKAELKKCQALEENFRMDYHKITEELERTFLLVKNLRLELSMKTEKLEKSRSLVENLRSESLKISDTLEKSRSLVANLSTEIRTKTEQLESSWLAMRHLQFETNVKSTALENSRLTVKNLMLENFKCKEALKHYQVYVDSLLMKSWNSKFTKWSRNSFEKTFDPHKQIENLEVKLHRSVIDEDCAMTEEPQIDSNLNDRTFVLSYITGSRDNESEIQKSTNLRHTDFEGVEARRLLPELSGIRKYPSGVQESPSKAPEKSSKDRESCNETHSRQLRNSLRIDEIKPCMNSRQNLMDVKSAKLTADFTPDYNDSGSQWRRRYEELWTVAQPFKDLLSAFDSQRQLLQGHRNAGKAEIDKLSHDFAKILNHEHERQMVSQILRLREQNMTLKKELELLWVRKVTTEVTRI